MTLQERDKLIKEQNIDGLNISPAIAKPMLNAVHSSKPKCYNCKHASSAFKIAGKTHHQCNHPKYESRFKSGELSPWDTLQEFYNTCESHEFRQA